MGQLICLVSLTRSDVAFEIHELSTDCRDEIIEDTVQANKVNAKSEESAGNSAIRKDKYI